MSLRWRLAILLAAVVTATVVLAWAIAGRAVIAPFAQEALEVYLDQAVLIAEKVAGGEDPTRLERQLHIDIRRTEGPPVHFHRHLMRTGEPCNTEQRGGHEVVWCKGPRAPVSVKMDQGWLTLRRGLDVARPRERVGRFLFVLLICMLGVGVWIAVIATRPLRTTQAAMARIAAGDLAHRLPLEGAKELRETASAFNQMAERVSRMLETERQLMAGISHELRTPLARLRLELEILRDTEGLPEQRALAMERDLAEADRLIGELLESSRLSLGDRVVARAPVDLLRVVDEAKDKIGLSRDQIVVRGASAPLLGDHDRLVRVIANLLENAVKYGGKDQPIEVTVDGGSIEVADRGSGVKEADLPRLFEPFYRATSQKSGLGLGLMIAHQVVTLHGGQISARNREGGGLVVRIELPSVESTPHGPLA